jgi:hypothetical protein
MYLRKISSEDVNWMDTIKERKDVLVGFCDDEFHNNRDVIIC